MSLAWFQRKSSIDVGALSILNFVHHFQKKNQEKKLIKASFEELFKGDLQDQEEGVGVRGILHTLKCS